ncbi:MAG: arginine--tRNA ligase [Deltaproteobacteria bacterium]|nr:MAG: arginine--tRNA ligase [Deltaproteobacteria bacterium]TMA83332.1 MAG: arginine--tRNA ligase [Deltaproteobacteria bacterium]
MKKPLEALLRDACERATKGGELLTTTLPPLLLTVPKEPEHGDLASNLALVLARSERRPPPAVAETIVRHLDDRDGILASVEIAGPGFINFRFAPAYWWALLRDVEVAGEAYGRSAIGAGRKVQLEFVSANPTGPLHVGHARGAVTGDALARLLAATGHDVAREYYVNDAGNQIAMLGASTYARYAERCGRAVPFPEDGYRGDYVREVAAAILAREGERLMQLDPAEASTYFGDAAGAILLDAIRDDMAALAIDFDHYVSERRLRAEGAVAATIAALEKAGYVYEADGARWFRSTAFGDDKDRPLVKTGGEFTYFAADVAYHRAKYAAGYERIIDVWGADHHGHVPRMKAAMQALGLDPARLEVVLVQIVSLTRHGEPVRMGKRSGEFVTLREIVDEVGADATRFFLLMRKSDAQLEFDLDLAKERSAENPVFYVQYAHARVASVFRAAEATGLDRAAATAGDPTRLTEDDELALIRRVAQFPEVVEGAALELEPHRVVFFLMELAGDFHRYYNRTRILGDDRELAAARLLLVANVQKTIRAGLGILGIAAPDTM